MRESERPIRTLLLTALTTLLMLGLSMVDSTVFLGVKTRKTDILSDIRIKQKRKVPNLNAIPDVKIAEKQDTEPDFVPRVLPDIDARDVYRIEDFSGDGGGGLKPFFSALSGLKGTEKVRVAWFGDSTIEGDLISQDVRRNLQDIFGGSGIGFVPITSSVSKFRASVLHNFSENWQTYSIRNQNPYRFPIGISGYLFVPARGRYEAGDAPSGHTQSWVEYGVPDKSAPFNVVRMFYGFLNGEAVLHVNFGDDRFQDVRLGNCEGIQEIDLTGGMTRRAKVFFSTNAPLAIYGAFVESDNGGVYVDNFSFRGSSGTNLNQIPDAVWKTFNSHLNYRLIILQYGANIADPEMRSFGWYEKGLTQVLTRLRNLFPDTGILVISAPDKSVHVDMEYQTNPAIPLIIRAQRNAAKNAGVAFWNLYEAMGGENSMPVWVERKLAAPDYTHLSGSGAREVARRITKAMLYEYKPYTGKKPTAKP
ncbi:MAG: hypothetical protein KA419_04700 [Acidobacteria bacterium]|nr:hypothetical protein [Acidobacteriota bacterium]